MLSRADSLAGTRQEEVIMPDRNEPQQSEETSHLPVYEAPRIVYRGELEAYAVVCNQFGGCSGQVST
jgi:hypothetical protein